VALAVPQAAAPQGDDQALPLPGLEGPAQVVRDRVGVPHIYAKSEHDAYFLVGYLQAQDRLFQMDFSRRQASGTLAELVGPSAIPTDVQLRTIGLARAAERSLGAISPESRDGLDAFSAGINVWLDTHPLPSEYAALELTSIPDWTALDSLAVSKLLAFGLSFSSEDIDFTRRLLRYQEVGAAQGFDGTKLFFEDVMRSEPFAHAPSIFPGEGENPGPLGAQTTHASSSSFLEPEVADLAEEAMDKMKAAGIPTAPADQGGSNIWVVSGAKSASGRPMVASDPHLPAPSPSTFYEVGIDVGGSAQKALSLYGVTFPGTPTIVHGTNGHVSWGSTVNPTDVTDVYQERLRPNPQGVLSSEYQGQLEPLDFIQTTYRTNQPGNGTPDDLVDVDSSPSVPPVIIIVPRRNNGPLISLGVGTGLSLQYTGFSPTREADFFRLLSRARTVREAIDAQRYFDFGAQNWMYADDRGNIGYKTSGEIPLREDLQAGAVDGLPPFFIRDGTGGNEWIADPSPAEDQALSYEILPFGEMDGLVNPARGWISNANQDPTGQTFDNDPLNELRPGGGIRYITPGHEDGNRNTRISTRLCGEPASLPECEPQSALGDGAVSFEEMQSIQADVKLNDAAVLVPHITDALAEASDAPPGSELAGLGADPQIRAAVARLAAWDFSTPTGIPQGYDASDSSGVPVPPTPEEVDASVAATIYSIWRGRALALIVDGPLIARGLVSSSVPLPRPEQAMVALRRLLAGDGTGASGIDFFAGQDGETLILRALRNALDLAASPAFADAFGGSTNLADYRWGKLHRKVFGHPLGGPFSIPPGAGFSDVGPGLPGVATDGGFAVVDASSHNPRASGLNSFMFGSAPGRRFVAEAFNSHPHAVQVIPGGESGNPAGRWFGNQLGLWLTDDYHPATTVRGEVLSQATLQEKFEPVP
jgi:penicillin G amidase